MLRSGERQAPPTGSRPGGSPRRLEPVGFGPPRPELARLEGEGASACLTAYTVARFEDASPFFLLASDKSLYYSLYDTKGR